MAELALVDGATLKSDKTNLEIFRGRRNRHGRGVHRGCVSRHDSSYDQPENEPKRPEKMCTSPLLVSLPATRRGMKEGCLRGFRRKCLLLTRSNWRFGKKGSIRLQHFDVRQVILSKV